MSRFALCSAFSFFGRGPSRLWEGVDYMWGGRSHSLPNIGVKVVKIDRSCAKNNQNCQCISVGFFRTGLFINSVTRDVAFFRLGFTPPPLATLECFRFLPRHASSSF